MGLWDREEYLASLLKTAPNEIIHNVVYDLRHHTNSIFSSIQILNDETITNLTDEQKQRIRHIMEQGAIDISNILSALDDYDLIQREKSDSPEL